MTIYHVPPMTKAAIFIKLDPVKSPEIATEQFNSVFFAPSNCECSLIPSCEFAGPDCIVAPVSNRLFVVVVCSAFKNWVYLCFCVAGGRDASEDVFVTALLLLCFCGWRGVLLFSIVGYDLFEALCETICVSTYTKKPLL